MSKLAILYHCHPINNGIYNLDHFLTHGYASEHDYFISCVDFDPPTTKLSNVNFFRVDNDSHDFGGFSRLLLDHVDKSKYKFFGFINSSALGPFHRTKQGEDWTTKFISQLNDETYLCGSTINCLSVESPHFGFIAPFLNRQNTYYHVQTYAYFLSNSALELLSKHNFYYYPINHSKIETIINYEIGLSRIILENGFNIACLIPEYYNVDFRNRSDKTISLENFGDPTIQGAIEGRSLDPYDVVFVKPTRLF